MVNCPICGRLVSIELINSHLDSCESGTTEPLKPIKSTPSKHEIIAIDDEEPPSKKTKSPLTILNGNKPTQKPSSTAPKSYISFTKPPSSQQAHESQSNNTQKLPSPPKTSQKDEEIKFLKSQLNIPLSERLRPKTLEEYVGQTHLLGDSGILRGFIEHDHIPSMILWGPPGTGKTSISRIISKTTNQRFIELNATNSGISELRKIFETCSKELFLTKRRTIVFCDEIHRYNKTQQDFFLPFVEKGEIILIGATTENPSFQINNALLSRCKVFTLKNLEINEIHKILNKGILQLNKMRKLVLNKPLLNVSKDSIDYISDLANGDSRIAINLLELVDSHYLAPTYDGFKVNIEHIKPILQKTHLLYDRVGDSHYDTISAFHKSIRGSDANAALWYLGKMLKGGENPLYIARRMIRIASEDVGVLDESCLPFAIAAYQAVTFVGLPEADLALVQCAVKLAEAKKSVKIYRAWNMIKKTLDEEPSLASSEIPLHLRNAPTKLMKELDYGKEYKYNPNFKDGKVKQGYMPKGLESYRFLDQDHLGDIIDDDI